MKRKGKINRSKTKEAVFKHIRVPKLKQAEQGFTLETFPILTAVTYMNTSKGPDLYLTHPSSCWLFSPGSTWFDFDQKDSILDVRYLFAIHILKANLSKQILQ